MHHPGRPRATLHLRWLLVALVACSIGLTPAAVAAAPRAAAPTQANEAQWLVMIYSDADDNVLEQDMLIDLQEAELVGSTDEVTIVVQTDRFSGSYDGMGDWTGAKRLLITQDDDMSRLQSEVLEDLGEVNMSDAATLQEFIEWAVTSFPAQKRMLIMSDHGSGWPGGWTDPDPGGNGADDIVLSEMFGDSLWLMEIDRALGQARENLGLDVLDVIGFDACLMSQLEVYTAMAPHALYAVASEEVEPGLGWAYAGFLGQLANNPAMGGDELAQHVVASYIDDDMRLEDPSYVGNLARADAAAAISPDTTLAAIDLGQIAPLNTALDTFVGTLQIIDQNAVAEARTYAQSFESVFGEEFPSPYIDLGHFVQLIQSRTDDPAVLAAADEINAAWQAAVIAEKHGSARPGSTGIAIYFPVFEMYRIADNLGYVEVAERFAQETQWDEFLAFHAGDTPAAAPARPASTFAAAMQALMPNLDPEYIRVLQDEIAAMVENGYSAEEVAQTLASEFELEEEVVSALYEQGLLSATAAAGAFGVNTTQRKPLQVGPIMLSAEVAYPDEPVTVEAEITGDRVGYLYSFIGRLLPEDEILIIEDQDYLFADEETTVGGVTYPKWPKGAFTAGFEWAPVVYAISDGTTSIRTLFSPETYGEEPTYTVDGIYRFLDGSPERYARLFFKGGEMTQVFGFLGPNNDGVGAPREITPQPGDAFIVLEQGWNLGDTGDEDYSGESGTLTFGNEPFFIEETPAPSGNYIVGIIAEDLDGNQEVSYDMLFVVGEEEVTEEGFVPLVDAALEFALLYPETWTAYAGSGEPFDPVVLTTADEAAQMTVSLFEYPDDYGATEVNLTALDDVFAELEADAGLENVEAVGDPVEYALGAFDAMLLDFSYEVDGMPYAGEVIASTPAAGMTYVVYFEAPAEEAEELLPDLDAVLYSFDVLIPGIDRAVFAAVQPDFGEIAFADDYSDPTSGLYDDAAAQEWGQGYYDPETEQYVYAMNPASGVIYDYYPDLLLPEPLMLEVSAQTAGAMDTAFGLLFGVQDDNHYYAFSVSGDGYFLVRKATDGELETLVDWTVASPFDTTEDVVNTLSVVGEEGVYTLFVNGEQVGEFADESYGAGSTGYMVENFDASAPAAFVFDDLVAGVPAE